MIRRIALAVATVCALLMVSAPAVHSAAPVEEVVAALEQNRVFVEPGAPQTTSDTRGVLADRLNNDDRLLIIMLDADESATEQSLLQLAAEVDETLGGGHIVAVSSGDVVIAYSDVLPVGQASELMRRAESVSTNSPEVMSTFIRNVHNYLIRNPEEVVEVPAGTQEAGDSGTSPLLIGGSLALLTVLVATLVAGLMERRRRARLGHTTFKGQLVIESSPNQVKALIEQLLALRGGIRQHQMVEAIDHVAVDVEAYFARNARNGVPRRESDERQMAEHLASIVKIVERYIDVQNNPRYYSGTQRENLALGERAVDGFADFVLAEIRKSSRAALTEYTVDTKILDAQRYRG